MCTLIFTSTVSPLHVVLALLGCRVHGAPSPKAGTSLPIVSRSRLRGDPETSTQHLPAHGRTTPWTRTVIPTMGPSGGPGVRTVCWEASFVNLNNTQLERPGVVSWGSECCCCSFGWVIWTMVHVLPRLAPPTPPPDPTNHCWQTVAPHARQNWNKVATTASASVDESWCWRVRGRCPTCPPFSVRCARSPQHTAHGAPTRLPN